MEVVLFMFRANGATRSFPLTREVTVIGRREDCDLRIPLTEVSRKHCRVIVGAEDVRVEDLGSSNGTFHNGQRVQESVVQPGDYLQVGPVTFIFQMDGTPGEEQIVPPPASDVVQMPAASDDQDNITEQSPSRPESPELGAPEEETMETMQPASAPVELPPEDPEIIIADDAPEPEEADDDIIDLGDNKH